MTFASYVDIQRSALGLGSLGMEGARFCFGGVIPLSHAIPALRRNSLLYDELVRNAKLNNSSSKRAFKFVQTPRGDTI